MPIIIGSYGNLTNRSQTNVCSIEIGKKPYVLVADGDAGLKIINMTNPSNPSLVSTLITKNAMGVSKMKIRGKNYAFLGDN